MHPIGHPHDIDHKETLAFEDGGLSSDYAYLLIRTTGGEVVVREIQTFEQSYKTPSVREYKKDEWPTAKTHKGVIIADLVAKKKIELQKELDATDQE